MMQICQNEPRKRISAEVLALFALLVARQVLLLSEPAHVRKARSPSLSWTRLSGLGSQGRRHASGASVLGSEQHWRRRALEIEMPSVKAWQRGNTALEHLQWVRQDGATGWRSGMPNCPRLRGGHRRCGKPLGRSAVLVLKETYPGPLLGKVRESEKIREWLVLNLVPLLSKKRRGSLCAYFCKNELGLV